MKVLSIGGLFANEKLKSPKKNPKIKICVKECQNQRETSFSSNFFFIPDFNIFTVGPGSGKYKGENVLTYKSKGFTIPKAERSISNLEMRKTPGYSYFPSNEKIIGTYLTTDRLDHSKRMTQRRTSFSRNFLVPDLNVFTDGPGTGKYSSRETIGKLVAESNIQNQPQFTIPRASRPVSQLQVNNTIETPGPAHYNVALKKEKIPGHYSFFRPSEKLQVVTETPGVGHYSPEMSIDFITKSRPSARIPSTRRFSNSLF